MVNLDKKLEKKLNNFIRRAVRFFSRAIELILLFFAAFLYVPIFLFCWVLAGYKSEDNEKKIADEANKKPAIKF